MCDRELKFEGGHTVTVELIGAVDPSVCRFGYKVGDAWELNVWENAGLCGLAYNALFPFITMYQTGGRPLWKRSEADLDKVVRTCPDLRAGFRFAVKKKQE